MTTIRSRLLRCFPSPVVFRQRLRRGRAIILTLVAIFTLLSATVVISQASQSYDLACRSIMDNAGQIIHSNSYAVNGALGIAISPSKDAGTPPTYAVRSTNYGLRAGYLPGYPTNLAPVPIANVVPHTGNTSIITHMPFVAKMIAMRGGCDPLQNP